MAASACHPSGVTQGMEHCRRVCSRGSRYCFAPGSVRSKQISVSSVSPGLLLQQLEALSPSSLRDQFSLSENPAGAAEGSALPLPRGGGQACSHAAFLDCFWHKSSRSPSAFQAQHLQSCHREKKLTQAAGGCRQWETTSGSRNHLGT